MKHAMNNQKNRTQKSEQTTKYGEIAKDETNDSVNIQTENQVTMYSQ